MKKYLQARRSYEKGLKIAIKHLGPTHGIVATLRQSVAHTTSISNSVSLPPGRVGGGGDGGGGGGAGGGGISKSGGVAVGVGALLRDVFFWWRCALCTFLFKGVKVRFRVHLLECCRG